MHRSLALQVEAVSELGKAAISIIFVGKALDVEKVREEHLNKCVELILGIGKLFIH